jgi:hypothetical protein
MSLEQAIGGLEDVITQLTAQVQKQNDLLAVIHDLQTKIHVVGAAETAQVDAPAETKPPAKARPSRAKTAPVAQPPVEDTAAEDDGFEGDEEDDGFGDDVAETTTKNYGAEDAKNAMKALRDGLRVTKGFDQDTALNVAKKALSESGFANINAITDDAANDIVTMCRGKAESAGVEALANFITKAAQLGTVIV